MPSLLTALQGAGGTVTRAFLFATLLPSIAFLVINVALFKVIGRLRDLNLMTTWDSTLTGGIGVLLFAMVVAALQPRLFQILEGDRLPGLLRRHLTRQQSARIDRLKNDAARAFGVHAECSAALKSMTQNLSPQANRGSNPDPPLLASIDVAWKRRCAGEEVEWKELQRLVADVARFLREPLGTGTQADLEISRQRVLQLVLYANDRSQQRAIETNSDIQARYPGDVFSPEPSSDNVLAPTTFGNIGRTMRSYALRRYGLDLDIFWTRFYSVMAEKQVKLFDAVQMQKTQVDLLVTLLWMTAAITILWTPALAAWTSGFAALKLAATGVIGCWLLYTAACESYLVFADQVRSGVDLCRMDVLAGLHVSRPAGTAEEEALWQRLGERVGYGDLDAQFLYDRK